MAEIESINRLLGRKLSIPDYQRPYKWVIRNIADLLFDIDSAINDAENYQDFRYRIGTIILNSVTQGDGTIYDVVDGQQRIISLVLIKLFFDNTFKCTLLTTELKNKESQANVNNNYRFIKDWFALKSDDYKKLVNDAFDKILEVVVISVDKQEEAFQLFDSQNTRGKALAPHDLLKAYHLREMKDYQYEMQHAVTKWEAVSTDDIRELFELYLFPIQNWVRIIKSFTFTDKDIDRYKGINEKSPYTYAKRAGKAMPHFQISESYIAGNDFFEMVEHYLKLLNDVKVELSDNCRFVKIKKILNKRGNNSAGFNYTKNLFYCSVLCYYDRFRNFDEQVIIKLFSWSFMLRVDMQNLGFDSINKYAVGDDGYTNKISMFSKINNARLHSEIANMQIKVLREPDNAKTKKWDKLYKTLKKLNGFGI